MHDVGHYPFAHVIEHYVAGRFPENKQLKEKIHHFHHSIELMKNGALRKVIDEHWGEKIAENAIAILQGNRGAISNLLDGAIDCDKIDYLKRDSYHCGVPYGAGFDPDEIISSMGCSDNGQEITFDIKNVHAIEGFMILQDQMLSAVYWHPTVRAIFAMFHRFLDGTIGDNEKDLIELVDKMKFCANDHDCINNVFIPELNKSEKRRGRNALEPLIRLHYFQNSSDIYRPAARYSTYDSLNIKKNRHSTVFQTIFPSGNLAKQTGLPINWENVKRLRKRYEEVLSADASEPGPLDVLVDVPWGKGSNRVVRLIDTETKEENPITHISHLDASIFENPTAYSAPVRVFVAPKFSEKIEKSGLRIREEAEERYWDKASAN